MIKVLIFSTIFIFGGKAFACSCFGYDVEEQYSYHDVVIIGKVTSFVEPSWWSRLLGGDHPDMKADIEVSKVFKGSNANQVVVYTNKDSAACGFPFQVGVEYAVFAKLADSGDYKGKLLVYSCNPTIHTLPREDYHEPERKRVMEFLSAK